MTTVLLSFALLVAFALMAGAAFLFLAWSKKGTPRLNFAIVAIAAVVAAVLAVHPTTAHAMAFIAAWIIVLWLTKVAYVNTRTAFKRVGTTSTRLQATQEVSSMFFLFALACIALHISLGYAVLAALIVWPAVNAIAKRREWPQLMRTAGR